MKQRSCHVMNAAVFALHHSPVLQKQSSFEWGTLQKVQVSNGLQPTLMFSKDAFDWPCQVSELSATFNFFLHCNKYLFGKYVQIYYRLNPIQS